MLEIAVTVLVIIWLLGFLSAYTLGGGIHLCLVLAALLLAVKLMRKPARPRRRSSGNRVIG